MSISTAIGGGQGGMKQPRATTGPWFGMPNISTGFWPCVRCAWRRSAASLS